MSKQLEKVERERDWMHGRLEECREQVAELRAYAGELAGLLSCAVLYVGCVSDPQNPAVQRLREDIRAALAKNPNPAGRLWTEASGSQATEASGAGRAGTELTGAQALGDSAGADPAFTGSPAVGTKASSGATNPTVGNCHETRKKCATCGMFTTMAGVPAELICSCVHQSGKKSDGAMYVTVPVMPTDAMLEALYGPYLSPTSHATRRAAWAEALAAVPPPSGIVIPPIGAHPELAMAVNQPPRSEFQVCNSPWVRARDRLPTPDDVPFAYRERDDSATYCVDSRGEFDSEFGTDGPPSHIVWMKMPRVPDDPADLQFVAGKKS